MPGCRRGVENLDSFFTPAVFDQNSVMIRATGRPIGHGMIFSGAKLSFHDPVYQVRNSRYHVGQGEKKGSSFRTSTLLWKY